MVKAFISFVFVSVFAVHAYAVRDLILFVAAAPEATQIAFTDYSDSVTAGREFESYINLANEKLSEETRPLVARLEVMSLDEIPTKLDELAAQDRRYKNARVSMIMFLGHGNASTYYLYSKKSYKGKDIAGALTSPQFQPKLAKDVGLYFGACNCGESLEPTNFQMELMAEFKARNEALANKNQTRSLVSIAHRFSAISKGYKDKASVLDTLLYKQGVFSIVHRMDMYAFKKLGRYASPFAGMGVAAGLFVMTTALNHFVSPDAVSPALGALIAVLPKVSIGLGVVYQTLSFKSMKWARKSEYSVTDVAFRHTPLAAGDGVWQMIRSASLTCEQIF